MNWKIFSTKNLILGLAILAAAPAFSTTIDADNSAIDSLKKAVAIYQTTGVLEMQTEKILTSPWKEKAEKSTGHLFLSKGKFRWEVDPPDKEWTIFDGHILWNVKFASPDFPGKNHVLHMKLNEKDRKRVFYLRILDPETLSTDFDVSAREKSIYALKPKKGSVSDLGFKDIQLRFLPEHLLELSYKDDVDNVTLIRLHKPQLKPDLFTYKPDAANDDVEEK